MRAPSTLPATAAARARMAAGTSIDAGHGWGIQTWLQPHSAANPTVPMPSPLSSAKRSGARGAASAASSTAAASAT